MCQNVQVTYDRINNDFLRDLQYNLWQFQGILCSPPPSREKDSGPVSECILVGYCPSKCSDGNDHPNAKWKRTPRMYSVTSVWYIWDSHVGWKQTYRRKNHGNRILQNPFLDDTRQQTKASQTTISRIWSERPIPVHKKKKYPTKPKIHGKVQRSKYGKHLL